MSHTDPVRAAYADTQARRLTWHTGELQPAQVNDPPARPVESLHPGALPSGRTTDSDPIRTWWSDIR